MEGGPAGGAWTVQGVLTALYAETSPATFHRVFGQLLGAAPVPVPVQAPVPTPPTVQPVPHARTPPAAAPAAAGVPAVPNPAVGGLASTPRGERAERRSAQPTPVAGTSPGGLAAHDAARTLAGRFEDAARAATQGEGGDVGGVNKGATPRAEQPRRAAGVTKPSSRAEGLTFTQLLVVRATPTNRALRTPCIATAWHPKRRTYHEVGTGRHVSHLVRGEPHRAPARRTMLLALGLLLAHWRETGMGELAKRMEESYNVAPWDSWWLCATGVAGATACNNALESFHHWLKQQAWPKLRVPFDTALFVCLPEMLVALREKNMLPIHRVVHVDGTHAAYRVYAHRRP